MQQITITVEGGVIQQIENIPAGVEVVVLDFDTDGAETNLLILSNGQKCVKSTWSSNENKN